MELNVMTGSENLSTKSEVGNTQVKSARSIQEFWIDFLLEEEFRVDPGFVASFVTYVIPGTTSRKVEKVVHSMTDKYGEADLAVFFEACIDEQGQEEKLVFLIENKITANFQPKQAERYRNRGEDGLHEKRWTRYRTILIAPENYIASKGNQGFNITLSLETIKPWLCPNDEARRQFKQARIDEAIEKKSVSGLKVEDLTMTEFRAAYFYHLQDFNSRKGTNFVSPPPRRAYWGDYWFQMKSIDLPAWAVFRHRAPSGDISIDFRDVDISKVSELEELLEPDMFMIASGKYFQHTSIRISIPPITSFASFDENQATVEAALSGAERLWTLYKTQKSACNVILAKGRKAKIQSPPYSSDPHQGLGT